MHDLMIIMVPTLGRAGRCHKLHPAEVGQRTARGVLRVHIVAHCFAFASASNVQSYEPSSLLRLSPRGTVKSHSQCLTISRGPIPHSSAYGLVL